MGKGIGIYYDENDLAELHEFIKWKTKKAATAQSDSAMNFSAGSFNVDHSLKETSQLIAQARREMHNEKIQQQEMQHRLAQTAQQRIGVATVPDRDAQKELDRQAVEEMRLQGEEYAAARNSGKRGQVYITEEEKSIRDGVVSWIKRSKLRGALGGRKTLNRN